jgi:WD40 repeat protein
LVPVAGRRGSKVLVPPSLTSDGQYLVSAGADSNVYIWNFDRPAAGKSTTTRGARRVRSCEHFFSEGVTSVATWPGLLQQQDDLQSSEKGATPTLCRDREFCSFGTWFSADGARGAATWPEEKLLPSLKYVNCAGMDECSTKVSAAWNKVVVTGGRDGVIRCFHNYGLPVKL